MIVICEECGKKYQLDPLKIKGKEATGTCTGCNHKIKVYHPNHEPDISPQSLAFPEEPIEAILAPPMETPVNFDDHREENTKKARTPKAAPASTSKKRLIGLRGKIFSLFFIVPIALIIIAGYLFIGQLNGLSEIISVESSSAVKDIAEQIVQSRARAVAKEVKLYLEAHPDLKKEDFNNTPEFVAIAQQKVGKKGYTVLNERETAETPEIIWVHPSKAIVGVDVSAEMEKKLGDKWERFAACRAKPYETKGYYLWIDNVEKFTAGVPIEGTPFNIAAATSLKEFTEPIIALQNKAGAITMDTRRIVLLIIGVTALLVAVIALFYGNILSRKIRSLTDVADRISMGDIDIEIENTDKDEIGDLAQSIARMQDSIRLSIERLRRRKSPRAA